MRVVYLPQADRDLLEIFLAIAAENEPAAHRLIERLRAAIKRLRDFPFSAPERDDIGQGVRGLSMHGYVILHRVTDEVQIVRILHAARDLPNIALGD
jgi:toxin ParE1/3/4